MKKTDYKCLELNPFEVIGSDNFLLTAGRISRFNTMTAGWGGFGYLWNKPVAYVFVRESRYTLKFLDITNRFSLSFFPFDKRKVLDFCGTHSGRNVDKAKEASITPVDLDGAVAFEEANMVITCTKCAKVLLDSNAILDPMALSNYPQGDYHYMYIGSIDGVYIN